MPRTPQLKSILDGALHHHYGLAPAASHQYPILNLDRVKGSVLQVKRKHQLRDIERHMRWQEDADRRASGRSILRRPSVDRLQCKGRTIYDAQYAPLKLLPQPSNSETPAAQVTSSHDRRRRRKALGLGEPRHRSLIEETLNQADSGRVLRKLSSVFALDIFITQRSEEVEEARNEILCKSEPTPSLTRSNSAASSDTEALAECIPEQISAKKAPLVADPLMGNFESFAIQEGYLINPLEPLGHMCDLLAEESNSEHHEAANQFFDMFVNTDDCEECY